MSSFMTRYAELSAAGTPAQAQALDAAKAEAYSHDESVWACADGRGLIDALMIDDETIARCSVDELEDVISDALVDASARGQFIGRRVLRSVAAAQRVPNSRVGAPLKGRNGKGLAH